MRVATRELRWRRLGSASSRQGELAEPTDESVCRPANRELRSDDRFDPGRLRRAIELRRAVHAVAIEQRHRRIAQLGRALDERIGQ